MTMMMMHLLFGNIINVVTSTRQLNIKLTNWDISHFQRLKRRKITQLIFML